MFRLALISMVFAARAAVAQDLDLTNQLAMDGLAKTEASLSTDTPDQAFALGAVQFLRGIEKSLQLRYRHNADFGQLGIPVLRLPLPPNRNAEPFYPALVTDLFRQIDADMATARRSLAAASGEFGVKVDLAAIWFDINENNARDAGESILDALAAAIDETAPADAPSLVVRFDTADAAWLRAYTHLLATVSNVALAFDPTEVITEVGSSIEAMNQMRGSDESRRIFMSPDDEVFVDMLAMVYGALNRQPNATHTRAARDHMLSLVAENRMFWDQVATETDNDLEWIPNANQTAALGFELPPDTGPNWLAVLADAEAILKGDLLVAHWRVSPSAGINVAKLLDNPVPVDLVTWLHGHGLLDYMENGPIVSSASMRQIDRMFGGDALFFMLLLN